MRSKELRPPLPSRDGRPVVGVITCQREVEDAPLHFVHACYVDVVHEYMRALPLLVPALGGGMPLDAILDSLDGVLFTGSGSNVAPHQYGETPDPPDILLDPARDTMTLSLIRRAVMRGMPIFGICRGFQEMNVAYGGSLWQQLHVVPGFDDHRPDRRLSLEEQYAIKHRVTFTRDGWLHRQLRRDHFLVNSRHTQGVRRLGDGLAVEAHADDGVIEAIRVRHARTFAYGVQWHPEWRPAEDLLSRALFDAFAGACRLHARQRRLTFTAFRPGSHTRG